MFVIVIYVCVCACMYVNMCELFEFEMTARVLHTSNQSNLQGIERKHSNKFQELRDKITDIPSGLRKKKCHVPYTTQ